MPDDRPEVRDLSSASLYEGLRWRARSVFERVLGRAGGRLSSLSLAVPDLIFLLQRVIADDRVPRKLRGELVGCALYLISPVDVVPEILFGPLGLVDDAFVLTRLLDALLNRVPAEVIDEHWPGERAFLEQMRGVAGEAKKVFALGFRFGAAELFRRGAKLLGGQLQGRLQGLLER